MPDHVFPYVPTRPNKERRGERARFVGLFQGCTGLWTPGCWLARKLQLKVSTTMDLGISIFLTSVPPVLSTCYNHFTSIVGVGKRGAY